MIQKIKLLREGDAWITFYVELSDGRVFHTTIRHYWFNSGNIIGGRSQLDYKGFKITLIPTSSTVFTPPYEVTNTFPEPGPVESAFHKITQDGALEWDTYFTGKNPVLTA